MKRLRLRYSVRWIMAAVLLSAVGLAVARHGMTHWGASEVFSLLSIALLATTILTWFRMARRQVFWVGFGLCGGAYLILSLASPMAEHLPTTWLLDDLHERIYANHPDPAYVSVFGNGLMSPAHGQAFRRAGQSVFSLLFALLGGVLAILLFPARAEAGGATLLPDGSLLNPGWREETGGRL